MQKISLVNVFSIVTIFSVVATFFLFSYRLFTFNSGNILGDIDIQAEVYSCSAYLKVIPSNRSIFNYPTDAYIRVYQTDGTLIGDLTATTDNFGEADIDLCANGVNVRDQLVDIKVTGKSHLTRLYEDIGDFVFVQQIIDLTVINDLTPGEVSDFRDEKINTLDITHLLRDQGLISTDVGYNDKYDLDLDGDIDSDDVDIAIFNFWKEGVK